METLFKVLKVVLPALITGTFSFLITKYTYHRNIPLEKLEIAYNRVYYPLYNFIKKEPKYDDSIMDKIKLYFDKYNKYIDRSTMMTFNSLSKCNTDAKKEAAYQNFKNNIYNRNSYLRRRLGYLEPSFMQIYKYSSSSEKSTFRILIEMILVYMLLIVGAITKNKIQLYCIIAFIAIAVILIIEILWRGMLFIYYKFRK